MNEYLSQINDNYGIVSDENGEIKVVTKSETNCEFQDILLQENELENLNQELIAAKEKLIDNKERTINGELCNPCNYCWFNYASYSNISCCINTIIDLFVDRILCSF